MTQLNLDGVALKQYDETYPLNFDPYAHQLDLQRLVREEDGFVAVNDSPTGGGKTSSWLVPALEERLNTVAIYPTNALITDQYDSIQETARDAFDHDVVIMQVTSGTLHEKREELGLRSNGKVIERWLREENQRTNPEHILFLTNPDIFVMMCRDLYHYPSRWYKRFEFAVVDEFHRAGRKERNTLRYLLDELYEKDYSRSYLRKIAFLSATPDEEQERKFDSAMAATYYRLTTDQARERQPFTDASEAGWHPVMPPVTLDVRTAPTFGTEDVLLGDDADDTLEFCNGGRTVVMLDGIHEVKRVAEWLDDELDCRVERIDGFQRENKHEKLQNFDVLVSNSAVEVGIDFEVDRILFAGHSRASFLQRLGRLRTDDGLHHARCYVPANVNRDLQEYDGRSVTREELAVLLEEVYPEPREPKSFDWRYSAVEALYHMESRLSSATTDQHESVKVTGRERIRRHFLSDANVTFGNADLQRTKEALDERVLTGLQWYRGDSIQALVYDYEEDQLKPYDLFYLLRYGKVEFFDRDEFAHEIPNDKEDEIGRYERYVDGFCTYHGSVELTDEGYGRDVYFTGGNLTNWLQNTSDRNRKPKVLPGLKVQAPRNDDHQSTVDSIEKLNQYLNNRAERASTNDAGILCYTVYGTSKEIKTWYDLGSFFFLYPASVQSEEIHSLAIGIDALYLHCHVQERLRERHKENDESEEYIGL